MKNIVTFLLGVITLVTPQLLLAQGAPSNVANVPNADAYIFVREDCSHCQDLKKFIAEEKIEDAAYVISYIDIYTPEGKELFEQSTAFFGIERVTPIALVDKELYVGYSKEVLGAALVEHKAKKGREVYSFAAYFESDLTETQAGSGCEEGSLEPCAPEEETLKIPVLGEINPQTASLAFLAIVLGFVDGFNPCAMWVLLTFLVILSQVGDRKKMIQVAGLFIVAEAVMYYLILNVWYQTWDFIALDGIVTPLVGLLALGSGTYFIYKYWTSRNKPLTCDVTSLDDQVKTENRIQALISKPMSFMVALSVIGLALSVNIIEFACSVGIPQAFTKVLELNALSFVEYQGYTLLYTLFYMADDFIVFGLAIWGYKQFYAVGQKYSLISTLVAGILMLALGAILILNPDILSF